MRLPVSNYTSSRSSRYRGHLYAINVDPPEFISTSATTYTHSASCRYYIMRSDLHSYYTIHDKTKIITIGRRRYFKNSPLLAVLRKQGGWENARAAQCLHALSNSNRSTPHALRFSKFSAQSIRNRSNHKCNLRCIHYRVYKYAFIFSR